jgi:hypothetical protein
MRSYGLPAVPELGPYALDVAVCCAVVGIGVLGKGGPHELFPGLYRAGGGGKASQYAELGNGERRMAAVYARQVAFVIQFQ